MVDNEQWTMAMVDNGQWLTMDYVGQWIAADLRSGRGGGHISDPKSEEQIYEKLKEYENEEVEEAT